jgi:hypothetical protein
MYGGKSIIGSTDIFQVDPLRVPFTLLRQFMPLQSPFLPPTFASHSIGTISFRRLLATSPYIVVQVEEEHTSAPDPEGDVKAAASSSVLSTLGSVASGSLSLGNSLGSSVIAGLSGTVTGTVGRLRTKTALPMEEPPQMAAVDETAMANEEQAGDELVDAVAVAKGVAAEEATVVALPVATPVPVATPITETSTPTKFSFGTCVFFVQHAQAAS